MVDGVSYEELAPDDGIDTGDPTNGAFGSPPAIFVRYSENPLENNFLQDFQWVKDVFFECDLRLVSAPTQAGQEGMINAFKDEYASNTNACAILWTKIDGEADWIVSGFNDDADFIQVTVDDDNDDNKKNIRKKLNLSTEVHSRNRDHVIYDGASLLGRTVINDYLDVELGTIENFLVARQQEVADLNWPAFKERIDEMNHKNATGSRTGDIITIMDGRKGYNTVNFAADSYKGWHGGPTISESLVPLIFAMPGDSFVDSDGIKISYPPELNAGLESGIVKAGIKSDGYLRNWHLSPLLSEIIKQFREGDTN